MATFLDIGILQHFSSIFTFILVYIIIYGTLEVNSPFGKDKKGLHALIALAISFIIIVSKIAMFIIGYMTPWFVVLFLFIFFILFAVRMFGSSDKDITGILKNRSVYPIIIVFVVIIIISSLSAAFGQQLLEKNTDEELDDNGEAVVIEDGKTPSTSTNSFSENLVNTLFHPKVLGMIVILLIGLFALLFLTRLT